jgi:hypothetical protein
MRYAMLICGDESEWNAQSPAELEAAMDAIMGWFDKWRTAGHIANGGEELDSAQRAKTVRPGPDGPVATDGPYLELKEVIGGFVVLEADDIDQAVAIAAEWPTLTGRSSIEVRPVIDHSE